MLLLRPSPGVCVDRQVILQLKIDEAARRSVESKHFTEEHQALEVYLEKHWFPSLKHKQHKEFDRYSRELSLVNRALWDLEDEIRHLKSLPQSGRERETKRIVSIAFDIPELNDDRAHLVGKINALFKVIAQEKLYLTSPRTARRKDEHLRLKIQVQSRG